MNKIKYYDFRMVIIRVLIMNMSKSYFDAENCPPKFYFWVVSKIKDMYK